jgi:diguanylate cyclase (GGDEF)-like protein
VKVTVLRSGQGTVVASAALALFAVVVFALNVWRPTGGLLLPWLMAPLSTIIPAVLAARIARSPAFPRATRRLWGHLAVTAGLAGVGAALNTYDAIGTGTPTQEMSALTVSTYGLAVVVLLTGLLRLPLGASGCGDMLRIGLDAGIVLLAAGVFMWQFQIGPMLQATGYRSTSLLAGGLTLALELVTVFAAIKVMLSRQALVAKASLRLFALGLLGGVVSGMAQPLIVDRTHLNATQIAIPIVMICATAAAEAQRRATGTQDRRRAAGKRRFSLLPYAAVAAIDALLLAITWSHREHQVVVVAAVALTALVMWRQITVFQENEVLLARLDHAATHDALTELPNRTLFTERLTALLAPAEQDRPVSVALIDLDDFKIVNDTFGHHAGDLLLTTAAERLRKLIREGDTAARLGGDEFVVILRDTGEDAAEQTAQRIVASLAEPVVVDGEHLPIKASIGIATGHGGDDAGDLLRRADVAMYSVKHGGGSNVLCYSPGMSHGADRTLSAR